MTAAVELTTDMLDDLVAAHTDLGLPTSDLLDPGLSPRELRAAERELGCSVPDEIAVLWRWATAPAAGVPVQLAPGYVMEAVRSAIDASLLWRDLANEVPTLSNWHSGNVVFASMARSLLVQRDGRSADRSVEYYPEYEGPFVAAASLGDLVLYWTRRLRDGGFLLNEYGEFDVADDVNELPGWPPPAA